MTARKKNRSIDLSDLATDCARLPWEPLVSAVTEVLADAKHVPRPASQPRKAREAAKRKRRTRHRCRGCPRGANPSARALASQRRKVIYIDLITDWNRSEQTVLDAVAAGFNVINLAFYLSDRGPWDAALAWANLSEQVKRQTMDAVHAAGAVVLVSLGGATDHPYGKDPAALGTEVAQWAVANLLDGVDYDLEGLQPGFVAAPELPTTAQLLQWLSTLNSSTRAVLGPDRYLTHAPQAPYLGQVGAQGTWAGPSGGYSAVYLDAKGSVDWLNVQFYNQSSSCYQNYTGIFVAPCASFPTTAISQLHATGLPYEALVLGMPVAPGDGNPPFPTASQLHDIVGQAQTDLGWDAGVMGWQWHASGSAATWIQTIYP